MVSVGMSSCVASCVVCEVEYGRIDVVFGAQCRNVCMVVLHGQCWDVELCRELCGEVVVVVVGM